MTEKGNKAELLMKDLLFVATTFIVTIFLTLSPGDAIIRELPLPGKLRECYQRAQNFTVRNYVGGLYAWYCETPIRSYYNRSPNPIKPQQMAYAQKLYNKVMHFVNGKRRIKRQVQKCLRKEIRMLTDNERLRLFDAINVLKRDMSVEPNKYDALALFHTGLVTNIGHGGPGFPGFHRVYLLLFEAALKEVDATICVPYWDSSLDSMLNNPAASYIWSDDFFGNWNGEALTGRMTGNWNTPLGVSLSRSVGRDGQLFTREGIEAIMSRNTYEEIFMLDQDPQYSLEYQHGGTHVFIGGDMERLETSAFDPIFFFHHAFVDYIWEQFRQKIRGNGWNPEEFPMGEINEYHRATSRMGFGDLTHSDGYLESFKYSFDYQPSPSCSFDFPTCQSKYLYCSVELSSCLPVNPAISPISSFGPLPQSCLTTKPLSFQNNFCADGVCDVNQWVWIPVQIMSQRSPDLFGYQSFPVQNGKINTLSDIYEPSLYSETSVYISSNKPKLKSYDQCQINDGVGKILVSSNGINYDGTYKESAIIDQRMSTSISLAYIAVKNPSINGVTKVIVRAHDQCGRICHTACKVPGSNPTRFKPCSGVLEINPHRPRQFGNTYAQAMLDVIDYSSNADCPMYRQDSIFATFYCDYEDHLPWVDRPINVRVGPSRPVPLPFLSSTSDRLSSSATHCRLTVDCVINKPCFVDTQGRGRTCNRYSELQSCVGNCQKYAVCIYGSFTPLRQCQDGMKFDPVARKCVFGVCNQPFADDITGHSISHQLNKPTLNAFSADRSGGKPFGMTKVNHNRGISRKPSDRMMNRFSQFPRPMMMAGDFYMPQQLRGSVGHQGNANAYYNRLLNTFNQNIGR